MTSLLIIAHGSRRAASNDEVRALAAAVRTQPGQAYAHVDAAFLELAEPSIATGLAELAAKGATEIVAFPYFLAAGTHGAGHPRSDRRVRRQSSGRECQTDVVSWRVGHPAGGDSRHGRLSGGLQMS